MARTSPLLQSKRNQRPRWNSTTKAAQRFYYALSTALCLEPSQLKWCPVHFCLFFTTFKTLLTTVKAPSRILEKTIGKKVGSTACRTLKTTAMQKQTQKTGLRPKRSDICAMIISPTPVPEEERWKSFHLVVNRPIMYNSMLRSFRQAFSHTKWNCK